MNGIAEEIYYIKTKFSDIIAARPDHIQRGKINLYKVSSNGLWSPQNVELKRASTIFFVQRSHQFIYFFVLTPRHNDKIKILLHINKYMRQEVCVSFISADEKYRFISCKTYYCLPFNSCQVSKINKKNILYLKSSVTKMIQKTNFALGDKGLL